MTKEEETLTREGEIRDLLERFVDGVFMDQIRTVRDRIDIRSAETGQRLDKIEQKLEELARRRE